MSDAASWLERYAEALGLSLDDDDVELLLDFARDVAHGTERKNAPLAAFLTGRFVGAGGDLSEALRRARVTLPPPAEES
jgi:hypothetical protein